MKQGICVHFNGIKNKCCDAGVNYYETFGEEPGIFKRLPCLEQTRCACASLRLPTRQELDAYELEAQRDIEIVMALDAAVASGQTEGTIRCTCGGTISWVHPKSLALRAKCDLCNWTAIS